MKRQSLHLAPDEEAEQSVVFPCANAGRGAPHHRIGTDIGSNASSGYMFIYKEIILSTFEVKMATIALMGEKQFTSISHIAPDTHISHTS
jgi:hypothetical protein